MVRKAKGGWRMCQDYTDLNKACPKDSFLLPRIDQLVDATAGHELLSFMDAYSGYNMIFMKPADNEHTAFITNRGLYYYNVMPIMEVYIDDMLVKSRMVEEHLHNLALMFGILKDYRMRLNPMKCPFGVSSGKFLGFMISQREIKAIIDMKVLKTQKDIQSLTGRVAALIRFISKATDKCVPFFKALKGGKQHIAWTAECDKAFQNLKNYMSRAPLLSKPLPGEVLFLYLSVSSTAVSSMLIRKPEKAELPIFYVSKVLQKPEASGRLVKWAVKLGAFDIQFKPRPVEKEHVVDDFISELTPSVTLEPAVSGTSTDERGLSSTQHFDSSIPVWILHVDVFVPK
ncbi:unnamed protein product [Prunus armeniaca]